MSSSAAPSPALRIHVEPSPLPGMVRYIVTDPRGLVIQTDMRDDVDSDEVEWFIRTYVRRRTTGAGHATQVTRPVGTGFLSLVAS